MISKCCAIILPPTQPPEKKKSYKELREEQLAAEAAAKKAAEQPEVRKVQSGKKYALTPTFILRYSYSHKENGCRRIFQPNYIYYR